MSSMVLPPSLQRHALGEAHHIVEWIDVLHGVGALGEALAPGFDLVRLPRRPVLGDPIMHDHVRRRREQRRAADVIAVVLADDDVAHRLVGHRLDEFLQDARFRRIVAGIDHHDALRGHHHQRVGVVDLADEGVDVVGDLLELGLLAGDGEACAANMNGTLRRAAGAGATDFMAFPPTILQSVFPGILSGTAFAGPP